MKADRFFVKRVIELHEQGKSVEHIMFSLDMPFEEEEED